MLWTNVMKSQATSPLTHDSLKPIRDDKEMNTMTNIDGSKTDKHK